MTADDRGLRDSSAALRLMQCLRAVAGHGVNVCAVIHQPSWRALSEADKLLLLSARGRVVYTGELAGVRAHFEALSFAFPKDHNPADELLDIVAAESERCADAWAELTAGCNGSEDAGERQSAVHRGEVSLTGTQWYSVASSGELTCR